MARSPVSEDGHVPDPFEQFEKLSAALASRAAELGLEQTAFFPIIEPGQPHIINVMYIIDKPIGEEPDPVLDPILEGILGATAEAEAQAQEEERQLLHELQQSAVEDKMRERAQRAKEMHDRLHDPSKGFLDD
jgi:hypothetical protein